MTADPDGLDDLVLDGRAAAAVATARPERDGREPLQTAALLSALARADAGGEWDRLWLVTGGWDLVSRPDAFPDPPAAAGQPAATHRGVPLSPATELAFHRLLLMGPAYGIDPVPPGALALVLLADPAAGASRALLAAGAVDHEELLDLVASELLGGRLDGFDAFLAATRDSARAIPTPIAPPEAEPERLMAVVFQFAVVPGLRNAQELLQEHREVLLSPAADAAMEMHLGSARQSGQPDAVTAVRSRRHLLRRCREIGIADAFAEARSEGGDEDDDLIVSAAAQEMATLILQFVSAPTWAASKRVVHAHDMLLDERTDAAFDVIIRGAEPAGDGAADLLRRHREILRRCRAVGVDAAFAEIDGSTAEDEQSVLDLVRLYATAPSPGEADQLASRHPRLLSDEAVRRLEAILGSARRDLDPEVVTELARRLDLLRRAVEVGVEAALAERRGGAPAEDELMALLFRSMDSGSASAAADVLREHPGLLMSDDDREVDRLIATARAAGNTDLATRLEQAKAFVAGSRALRGVGGRTDATQLALLPVVYEYVRADSWPGSRRVVEAHPELLEAAADRLLGRLVTAAEHQGDQAAAEMFTTHRRLLQRARESGVPAAFDEVGRSDEEVSVGEFMERFREARAEMDEMGTPGEVRVSVLGQAATMLVQRHRRTGETDAIVAAVECWDGVVAAAGPAADRHHHLNNLASALTARYTITQDVADLTRARDVTRAALAADTLNAADRAGTLTNLGNILADLGTHTGTPADLDEAVVVYEAAVSAAGRHADNRTGLLANLAEGLRLRFDRDGAAVDLDDSIAALRGAVGAAALGDPMVGDLTSNLAVSLVDRFERDTRPADLDEAIAIYERAVPELGAADDQAVLLGGYGKALVRRHDRDGILRDLDDAEVAYRRAAAAATDAARLADCLAGLGGVLRARFRTARDPHDLDAAIRAFEQAAATAPESSDARASLLAVLGEAVVERYHLAGDPSDLDAAIDHQGRAVQLTPVDSPDWAGEAASLGNRYLARSSYTAGTGDLDAAVGWGERAVRATPPDSADLPRHLANLGTSFRERYQATGDLGDLDRSFAAHARAITAVGESSGDTAKHLVGWGQALLARFEQAGESADLARAVDTFRRAVAAGADDPDVRPIACTGLANSLRVRFANTARREDLDEALGWYQRVLDETPAGSPDRCGWLANLANGLDDSYDAGGDPDDLSRAVSIYRESLNKSPVGWRSRRGISVNLAESLLKRQEEAPSEEDLAESIRRCDEAVNASTDRTPGLPLYLATLARGLRLRADADDLAVATALYRRCCAVAAQASPRSVIATANTWGSWATERERWDEAAEAFDNGLEALRILVGKQGPRRDKEEWLRGARRIAAGLAYARAMSDDAEGAVVAMEQGRAVLLAEKLAATTDGVPPAPTYRSITQNARTAPIAYLAAAAPGGVALIVGQDGTVTRVLLPGLASAALRERTGRYVLAYSAWLAGGSVASWDAELDDAGQWLWDAVMRAVLAHLPPGTPELVLVPGGYLGLLPLHAACVPDPATATGRRYVIDEVRISYSANAMARGAAVRIAETTGADSVLVVEDPLSPGATPIPMAGVEAQPPASVVRPDASARRSRLHRRCTAGAGGPPSPGCRRNPFSSRRGVGQPSDPAPVLSRFRPRDRAVTGRAADGRRRGPHSGRRHAAARRANPARGALGVRVRDVRRRAPRRGHGFPHRLRRGGRRWGHRHPMGGAEPRGRRRHEAVLPAVAGRRARTGRGAAPGTAPGPGPQPRPTPQRLGRDHLHRCVRGPARSGCGAEPGSAAGRRVSVSPTSGGLT